MYKILYPSSLFLLTLMFSLVKTDENKVDFIKKYLISIWPTLITGAIIALLLNFFNIGIGLKSITISFLFCIVGFIIYFGITKSQIQKFSFNFETIIVLLFCIIMVLIIFFKVFGLDFSLAYGCTDAGRHFRFAKEIYETNKLNRMHFTALYNSLFMEMFKSVYRIEHMYKPFIISDALFNLLNVFTFYIVASDYIKTKFSKYSIYFVLFFYFLGWPTYSWTSGGFVYFGVGVSLFMYGIWIMRGLDKAENRKIKIIHIIYLVMSIYGITQCYFLFTPIYIISIMLYFVFNNKEKLKKIDTKLLIKISLIVIPVFVIVAGIIFLDFFDGKIFQMAMALLIDGKLHKELYRDFIFLLPITIYMCVYKYKNKNFDSIFFFNVSYLGFISFVLLQNVSGVLSDYYYYKFYYLGWALMLINFVEAIEHFWNEKKDVIYYCILPIIIFSMLEITGMGTKITGSGNEDYCVLPIFSENIGYLEILHDKFYDQKQSMLIACEWANDNLETDSIPIIAGDSEVFSTWHEAFVNGVAYYVPNEDELEKEDIVQFIIEMWSTGIQYFTVSYTIPAYEEYIEIFENFECVYTNDFYKIYKFNEN